MNVLALTLDLDDTLWPIWPAIARAEVVLHDWLASHAPATAARYDTVALRGLRDAVAAQHPEWSHDLTRIRLESLREALRRCGDDPALADAGFALFFEERQRVDLFPDVLTGLERLATRFPLFALTNGNADLQRVGLARFFRGGVTARGFGVGKPDPRIFSEACRLAGVPPAQVLHVGDDLLLDVHGALGAGLQAAWMARPEVHPEPVEAPQGTHHVVADLHTLAQRLGA
ncbi:HAD family hydrolase [Eleftheria terrae]|uniref:HAD family hydrolase n=1 Tax=Eleftheria terrae TaxID=1597781 RepID=UPI00263AD026|nr:HAD-IA family hydrolase [Eleftheria terrae]WKB52832.1 HAD-IA family hydrolase [Eleftheria terrae]